MDKIRQRSTIFIVIITYIWVGMLLGISFLEAPLKFQAPGISLLLGLGIGKLVFGVLVKIEMAFSLLIIAGLLLNEAKSILWIYYLIPISIVVIDNIVLMPILNDRIDLILQGESLAPSSAHWWYIALELVKAISLFSTGIYFLKTRIKYHSCKQN